MTFSSTETLAENFRKTGTVLITRALKTISDESVSPEEKIHQARVACKRIRALLRLVRKQIGPNYNLLNIYFRDLAAELSALRDKNVIGHLIPQMDDAFTTEETVALLSAVTAGAEEAEANNTAALIALAKEKMTQGLGLINETSVKKASPEQLMKNLKHIYAPGRKLANSLKAKSAEEDFHTWRKNTKYLRFQLEFLSSIDPQRMKAEMIKAEQLACALGDEHDMTVLCSRAGRAESANPELIDKLKSTALSRRKKLRKQCISKGKSFYAEKPGAYTERLVAYWKKSGSE